MVDRIVTSSIERSLHLSEVYRDDGMMLLTVPRWCNKQDVLVLG